MGTRALSTVRIGTHSPLHRLVFEGTADDARTLLIGISATVITVIALVLGLTVVALQLSSTQFSPRLLRNFLRDRPNRLMLSAFVATFAYCMAGLYTVGVSSGERTTNFPRLAVSGAIVLMFASLGVLVYNVYHLAHSMQIDEIMRGVERGTTVVIKRGPAATPRLTCAPTSPRDPPSGRGAVPGAPTAAGWRTLDSVSTEHDGHDARRTPDAVWLAWLAAAAVLVVLAVNVVRHLTAPQHMHMSADDALFRSGGAPLGPLLSHRIVTAWHVDAVALAVIALLAAWYASGLIRRRRHHNDAWPLSRILSFGAGLAVCAFATNGSIAVYDMALFSAHMLGHLALVMAAPALLVAGRPLRLAIEASQPSTARRIETVARGRVVSLLTAPPVALACYTAVIVGSHLTGVMDTIMRNTLAGQVEHLVYLVVGCQFFVLIVGDEPIRWRLSTPARWGLLALSMAVDTFTGVILMMSTTPIAMDPQASLHVDPLTDTHTGGAIMWFGGDAIMAAVMILLVIGWLRTSGRSLRDRDSWLEQARATTLHDRTGSGTGDLDDDDARLDAYNSWLAHMSESESPRS